MAEVSFIGGGNTGFPNSDVQLLPANAPQSADVQLVGSAPAPGEESTLTEFFSPTLTAAPEFTQTEFFNDPKPVAASENPNDNDLLYVVVGGLTSGAQGVNVRLVRALKLEGDQFVEQGYITDNLQLYAGVLGPSGLVGKQVIFIQPTGIDTLSPIRGATGIIAQVLDVPTGNSNNGNPLPSGLAATGLAGTQFGYAAVNGIAITFADPISVQPTNGDRFIIKSDDRTLRRTPVLEVILE